jgi:hypothetical protein
MGFAGILYAPSFHDGLDIRAQPGLISLNNTIGIAEVTDIPQLAHRVLQGTILTCLALLAVLLVCVSRAPAQTVFGLRGGLNSANLILHSDGSTHDSRRGMCIGIYGEYLRGPRTSLQTELSYTTKGAKQVKTGEEVDLTYVEFIPVLARTGILKTGPVISGICYGVGVSFRTNAESDMASKFDLGLVGGAEIGCTFAGRLHSLQVRYERGLIPIDHSAEGPYNSVISVLIGFDVPIRAKQ